MRAHCGHRFCRACVLRFWDDDDEPFPCPECAYDGWQSALEPCRAPLSRRLLALEEAAAGPARDGRASEAALQLLCLSDTGPLCTSCRLAKDPEPPGFEPRWRKALRGKVRVCALDARCAPRALAVWLRPPRAGMLGSSLPCLCHPRGSLCSQSGHRFLEQRGLLLLHPEREMERARRQPFLHCGCILGCARDGWVGRALPYPSAYLRCVGSGL